MKIVFLLISAFMLISACVVCYAHPPQDIIINFDPTTKMLYVEIVHNVANLKSHYIKKVNVDLNGKEIIEQKFSRQDNLTNQIVSYLIPDAKPGDKISVEAYCSVSGKLEEEVEVGK